MKLLVILLTLLMTTVCYADVYVCLDKVTNEPKGMVDIHPGALTAWGESFIMIPADESYRGRNPWELKFEGNKLRHATKNEIQLYKDQLKDEQKALKKQDALNTLGLSESDIDKIKKLKDE